MTRQGIEPVAALDAFLGALDDAQARLGSTCPDLPDAPTGADFRHHCIKPRDYGLNVTPPAVTVFPLNTTSYRSRPANTGTFTAIPPRSSASGTSN